MFFWKRRGVNSDFLLTMLWEFQDRIMRYLRELLIKEGTCGLYDYEEFFHWGGGLLDFLDRLSYGGQDFLDIKGFK